MHAIVMYSGGIGSWAAGMRAVARYGPEHTTLLFSDTLTEDEDLYRFLEDGAAVIGVPVTRIADGRDVWQVMHDRKFLGNTRVAPCSEILKQQLTEDWVRARYTPETCIRLLGMDWCQHEQSRLARVQAAVAPYTVDAPLFWDPPIDKDMGKLWALKVGLRLPRLYDLGFEHNNCGGFCVKAGQAQFALLYRTLPERYRWHAAQEETFRQRHGKDVSILRDRRGGRVRPLTLTQFAARLDAEPELPLTQGEERCPCFVS